MTKLLYSAGRIARVLLLTLSTVGTVVSFSLFFGLESIETALASKGTLSNLLAQAEIQSLEQSIIEAVREWRSFQQLDIALWGLMFVTSCVSLVAYSRGDAAASSPRLRR